MANLLFNDTKATDRSSAAGFVPARTECDRVPMGVNSIVRHRGVTAAGETSALVARCVL